MSAITPQPKSKPGFTLIELLVVIAIIAILAAILFPVFASARERGRNASCLSNLHQIGLAVIAYADDHRQRVPFACDWEDRHDNPNSGIMATMPYFWHVLQPYTKGEEVWRDPSDKGVTFIRADKGGTGWPNKPKNLFKMLKAATGIGNSYTYHTSICIKNWNALYGSGPTPQSIDPMIISQIKMPSRCCLVMDPLQFRQDSKPTQGDWNAQWHVHKYPNFGWNMVFADGHAETITMQKLYNPPDNDLGVWLLNEYYIR